MKHLIEFRTGRKRSITNYLDDFLFIAIAKWICNQMINSFLQLCTELNLPVTKEKTEWATTKLVFLGILLDGLRLLLCIPLEKKEKAIKLLDELTGKKKITVKQLQILTSYLNFLTKAIVLGHTFTRRIYSKFTGLDKKLKPHHHVTIDKELRFDCEVWRVFLSNYELEAVCHPMMNIVEVAKVLNFYTDASTKETFGMGGIFEEKWFYTQWLLGFIKNKKPSIEYLELLGVAAAVLTWSDQIRNKSFIIFCDNQAVVEMLNKMTSTCKNCMYLIRLITFDNLIHIQRIFARYIKSSQNDLADSLSRMQLNRFWKLVRDKNLTVNKFPSEISPQVWSVTAIWQE